LIDHSKTKFSSHNINSSKQQKISKIDNLNITLPSLIQTEFNKHIIQPHNNKPKFEESPKFVQLPTIYKSNFPTFSDDQQENISFQNQTEQKQEFSFLISASALFSPSVLLSPPANQEKSKYSPYFNFKPQFQG
jgi:hypothetical protein